MAKLFDKLSLKKQDQILQLLNDDQELLEIQENESLYEATDRFLDDDDNVKEILNILGY
jgi:hypothetical protein